MASAPKKRRTDQGPPRSEESLHSRGNIYLPAANTDKGTTSPQGSSLAMNHAGGNYHKVQEAKKYAVAQAQQDGCTGNFRSFDSLFRNFLVPVIPTHEDLAG